MFRVWGLGLYGKTRIVINKARAIYDLHVENHQLENSEEY